MQCVGAADLTFIPTIVPFTTPSTEPSTAAFTAPALVLPQWPRLHRLIPSHFPPIDLFEAVADPAQLEIVYAIEALTNDRLKESAGELHRVAPQDRIAGPGSSPVMAAFTHAGYASRFTDGSYGVYYAASTQQTALAETVYHRERFLSATDEPDTALTMREYVNQVALPLHDIRGEGYHHLHQPDAYPQPQAFAQQLRSQDSHGLLYNSVRKTGGECIAAFRPKAITIPVQGQHFKYVWSGRRQQITAVLAVEPVIFK